MFYPFVYVLHCCWFWRHDGTTAKKRKGEHAYEAQIRACLRDVKGSYLMGADASWKRLAGMLKFARSEGNGYVLSVDNWEWRGAKRSEIAILSFFLQSYWKPKHRNISETIDFFFGLAYGTKNISFWPYKRYPWQACLARPALTETALALFDQFWNFRIKFWIKKSSVVLKSYHFT